MLEAACASPLPPAVWTIGIDDMWGVAGMGGVCELFGSTLVVTSGWLGLGVASPASGARCNLTVLDEPGQDELGKFLAEHQASGAWSLRGRAGGAECGYPG